MNRVSQTLFCFIAGFASMVAIMPNLAHADLVVIANKQVHGRLTKTQLQNLYRGEPVTSQLNSITVYNQTDGSDVRNKFYKKLMDWDQVEYHNYWGPKIFSGDGNEPQTIDSDAEAISLVENNPQSITYIDSSNLKGHINDVSIIYDFDGIIHTQSHTNSNSKTHKHTHAYTHTKHHTPVKHHTHTKHHTHAKQHTHTKQHTQAKHHTHTKQHAHAKQHLKHTYVAVKPTLQTVVTPARIVKVNKSVTPTTTQPVVTETKKVKVNKSVAPTTPQPTFKKPVSAFWKNMQSDKTLNSLIRNRDVKNAETKLLNNIGQLQQQIIQAMPYLQFVETQTDQHKLPTNVALLPFVLSNYATAASNKNTQGLWGLTTQQALNMGLAIHPGFDGRLDIPRSTETILNQISAAYKKTHNLRAAVTATYATLDDHANISSHENKGLYKQAYLKNIITKWIALVDIIQHAQQHNLTLPATTTIIQPIVVNTSMNLIQASKLAASATSDIDKLNPALQNAGLETFTYLWTFNSAQLKQINNKSNISKVSQDWAWYNVKPGDTIENIANNLAVSKEKIMQWNSLNTPSVRPHQALLIILD